MISLILPNYNGKKLLQKNLPAVLRAFNNWQGKYEIIVVDDASSDNSIEFLKENYPQIKIVKHQFNQRFAQSCNDGVRQAKGEIVILLNTDVVPEKEFLKPLLANFKNKNVFAVGCREESLVGGKVLFSGRALGIFKRGILVHWRAQDQSGKKTLWAAGGSAAYRKEIWDKLGGFDTLYKPAYGEDIDISYRAWKSGYQVLFQPKAIVFHQHETTNKKSLGENKIMQAALKNQLIFTWKNVTDRLILISHLLWLPYYLIFASISTKGIFLLAFFQALFLLPQVIKKRNLAKKLFIISDKQLLANVGLN